MLPEKQLRLHYLYFLGDALARHAGEEIAILDKPLGKDLWVDIPMEGSVIGSLISLATSEVN